MVTNKIPTNKRGREMSLNTILVNGKIHLVTGLHIGAGNDEIHIGGIDNQVVKDREGLPYIPGSSLKGKIRCLLEISEGTYDKDGKRPSNSKRFPNSLIPKMFGDTEGERTRLLFRDCFISKESKEFLLAQSIPATESKSENSINRLTGKADNPRNTERAISGLNFDYEIVVRLFENDNEAEIKAELIKGMKMLENDALGGSGSRGYGKIKFEDSKWNGEPLDL